MTTTKLPKAKLSAFAYLKSFGGSIVDSYTGPRPPPVVFPPPSWEIDDETYKKSPEPSEPPTEPPLTFARRIGALIDSLPTLPSAVTDSVTSSSSQALGAEHPDTLRSMGNLAGTHSSQGKAEVQVLDMRKDSPSIQDEGKQGSPVPPEMDKDLIRMLGSEEIMNGQSTNDTKSNPKGKNTSQQTSNIWNILASLKSNIAMKGSETPSPSAVEEDDASVMMYAPLEPTNDSKLEIAESETVLEYVDDPLSPTSTSTPESDNRIDGSKDASTTQTLPTSAQKSREKHKWVPSTTNLSLLATWWGYRIYLPPPVMTKLNGMSLKTTARAAMLTTALKWVLDKVPLMLVPVQFRPAVKMLKTLSPIVSYVGVFIAWSWDRVKSLDEGECLASQVICVGLKQLISGNGVVLTATWLLPVALLPMSWDAGDIHGPRLAPQQEKDERSSHDNNTTEDKNATKSNDNKGKQKQAKKKSIFPW